MRSVIKLANKTGISDVVKQQFEIGKEIVDTGLVPIIEPEVDIKSPEKSAAEVILKAEILGQLNSLNGDQNVMLKLTLPNETGFFGELVKHPRVIRVVALSGGYSREEANKQLAKNPGVIASFSRALTEGLSAKQTESQFNGARRGNPEHLRSLQQVVRNGAICAVLDRFGQFSVYFSALNKAFWVIHQNHLTI